MGRPVGRRAIVKRSTGEHTGVLQHQATLRGVWTGGDLPRWSLDEERLRIVGWRRRRLLYTLGRGSDDHGGRSGHAKKTTGPTPFHCGPNCRAQRGGATRQAWPPLPDLLTAPQPTRASLLAARGRRLTGRAAAYPPRVPPPAARDQPSRHVTGRGPPVSAAGRAARPPAPSRPVGAGQGGGGGDRPAASAPHRTHRPRVAPPRPAEAR